MNFFTMPDLDIDSYWKKCLWKSPLLMTSGTQVSVDTVRWPCKLIFCLSDTSKVQLKLNWTVGERLLPCDQLVVCKCRLTLFKAQWAFLQRLVLNFIAFEKRAFEKGLCWCHATRRELIRISDGLANENQFYNAG